MVKKIFLKTSVNRTIKFIFELLIHVYDSTTGNKNQAVAGTKELYAGAHGNPVGLEHTGLFENRIRRNAVNH